MDVPTITLPDGRVVSYLDGGDPDGYPVIGLHGTPGCRLTRLPDDTVYARARVRYITTDRAGYGQSSRHHGRCVADEAADVRAVADALGEGGMSRAQWLHDPASFMGEDMSEGDQEVLARPEVVAVFRRIMAEQAAHGVGGSVDDTLAFARPWGFDLSAITVPVLLTYGLQDFSCPPDHGRWLARHLPTATVVVDESGGHLPQDMEVEIATTYGWLRTGQLPASVTAS